MKTCKVCKSHAINHRCHGRDGSDDDLCDVCYWRKRSVNNFNIPNNTEIFEWLKEKKYQTDYNSEGYLMHYNLDMPDILIDFFDWVIERSSK